MDVLVGVRVVRGPNWTWGEQDGGEGHVGTVAEVLKADRSAGAVDQGCSGPCIVTVQWDCGNRCRYRCGVGDRYDLRVLDSAPAGIKHHRVMCNICGLQLTGMRWKCVKCYDYDLCTFCYMSGRHELDHEFDRMDTPRLRVRVPTRAATKKKEARGIYPNAEVVPGRDWIETEQTIDGLHGTVIDLEGHDGNNSRGFAEVEWSDSGKRSIHKVGDGGKVELRCVESSCISYYYPDHLPNLGAPLEDKLQNENVQTHNIASGDFVRVELDPEVFRAMHEEEYGWSNLMLAALGNIGKVKKVLENGDLKVMYAAERHNIMTWTICADAVVKVDKPNFSMGDLVRVNADERNLDELHAHTEHHRFYVSEFFGRVCRVIMLLSDGCVLIEMRGKVWNFDTSFLSLHDDVASLPWPTVLPQTDDLEVLRKFLQQNPDQVNMKMDGRTALHCASADDDLDRVKLLLEFGAGAEIEDNKNNRPLHYCCMVGATDCGEVLINAGTNVNAKGTNESTPLILAANGGHVGITKVLLKQPNINVHEQDAEGNTALHLAVLMQNLQLVSILLEAGADPSLVNFRLYNPWIDAARIGSIAILECMIDHSPKCVKITNDFKYTALHAAAYYNNAGVVPLVVGKGKADINSRDEIKQTALHVAVIQGATPVVEELVNHGADINATNDRNVTPLHALLTTRDTMDVPTHTSPEMLKLQHWLMGKVPDNHNHMFASLTTAAFLLSKGADMHIPAHNGNTAYKLCPYLATLMTVLADKGDLQDSDSSYSAGSGVLNTYGTVPALERVCLKCGGIRGPNHSQHARDDKDDRHTPARLNEQGGHYGHPQGSQTGLVGHFGDGPERMVLFFGQGFGGGSELAPKHHSSDYYEVEAEVASCFLCDSPANVTFHPCGHSVMCSQCAKRAKKCPTCRRPVDRYTISSDYY